MSNDLIAGDSAALKEAYRAAGKSKNTSETYSRVIKHYRDVYGGLLPASPAMVSNYLVRYAGEVKVSTARLRLAALSKWHVSQGFYNPVASSEVKEVMQGIAKTHQSVQTQAPPLTFDHLREMCHRLESQKLAAIQASDQSEILRTHRDLALILVGFWQGFRSDELSRVEAQNVRFTQGRRGMVIFLPYSKTDTNARGRNYTLQALRAYCPVDAMQRWIEVAGLDVGPVFKGISRWGKVAGAGINSRSIETILNRVADGLFEGQPKFSTHSLRRGFADWAVNAGWSVKALCAHVGWKSVASAARYMPEDKDFGSLALEQGSGPVILAYPGTVAPSSEPPLFATHTKIDHN